MRVTSTGTGIRAHLLDVQTPAGALYYWSDQQLSGIAPVISAANGPATVTYNARLLNPPAIKRTRSLATDSGSFVLQNLSGDTLARDFERILRRAAIEGAICAYRYFHVAAETADLSFQGRISVGDVSTSSATLSIAQMLDGSADTPRHAAERDLPVGLGQAALWRDRRYRVPVLPADLPSARTHHCDQQHLL